MPGSGRSLRGVSKSAAAVHSCSSPRSKEELLPESLVCCRHRAGWLRTSGGRSWEARSKAAHPLQNIGICFVINGLTNLARGRLWCKYRQSGKSGSIGLTCCRSGSAVTKPWRVKQITVLRPEITKQIPPCYALASLSLEGWSCKKDWWSLARSKIRN